MEGASAPTSIAAAVAAVASSASVAPTSPAAAAIAAIVASAAAARGAPTDTTMPQRHAVSAMVCDAADRAVERQVLVVEELLWLRSVHGHLWHRRRDD